MASEGYPGSYAKGAVISGLDKMRGKVYHMGTKADPDGKILTSGGRVLMVVGEGDTVAEANQAALADVAQIGCPSLFHRTDIGHQAL